MRTLLHLTVAFCLCGMHAGASTLSGFLNDPANTALRASDLSAPLFGDDFEIANNVALYEITIGAADAYRFLSTGFAAGGIDPYFTLFLGTGNGATVLGSNYVQAFSTGGDFDLTFALAAGDYTVGIGAFANMSFAENFGSGTLGDGFTGLGVPSLGTTYYNVEIATGAAAPEPRPVWLATLGIGVGLLWRRRRNAAAGASLAFAIPAHAGVIYSIEKVTGSSDGYFTISGTTGINNHDAIVFDARVGPNVNQNGLFEWSGGAITTIAKTTQAGGLYAGITPAPSINSAGFVPFRGILPDGSTGIFVGNGGVPTSIATADCASCDFAQISRSPAINDAGVVVFQASHGGADHIYAQSMFGGPLTLIADTGVSTPFSTFGQLANLGLAINASGTVAFHAGLKSGINDDGLYLGFGANVIDTIAEEDGVAPNGETFVSFSAPSLNDAGDVAFCGSLSNTEAGIYLWHGGSLTTIADTVGAFSGFTFPDTGLICSQTSMPSLNDAGQVAFFGHSNQGGDAIYLWDGALHRIIGEGDSTSAGEITSIRYFAGGLNNSGDFPFAADLGNGSALFLARNTSAPEPAAILLFVSGLAAFAWRRPRPLAFHRSKGEPTCRN